MVSAAASQPVGGPSSSSANVKPATPDLILFNEDVIPVEQMADLTFQDIGGQEILSVARNDIVNGQKILYSPIKNLANISLAYNSHTIFTSNADSTSFFKNFAIKLEDYTPESGQGTGDNGEYIYIDKATGNLIVNVINMSDNEDVDIQVVARSLSVNDIIN